MKEGLGGSSSQIATDGFFITVIMQIRVWPWLHNRRPLSHWREMQLFHKGDQNPTCVRVCVCALRFRMRRLKNMELRAFKSRLYFERPPSQLCGGEVTGKSSVSRSLWFAGLRPYATQWLAKRCGGGFCFGYGAVDRKSFPLRPAPGRQKRGNTKCFKCWAFQTTPCFHNWWPNCNRCACRHYPMHCR